MTNVNKLIQDLTLREKISLMSGFNSWYTNKIDRLGIPSIKMSDGPNGVRGDSNSGKSSACFPCAISIGSTWDMDLINQLGIALGEEAKVKDVDVLLGPTINIHRHPLGGRHFESFSEDPFLTGKIATEYVKGVQSQDVAACLKHFIGNDTEYERHLVSSNIDEKTLREIYLLPFEMGIKEGNAQVVMSAYNKPIVMHDRTHRLINYPETGFIWTNSHVYMPGVNEYVSIYPHAPTYMVNLLYDAFLSDAVEQTNAGHDAYQIGMLMRGPLSKYFGNCSQEGIHKPHPQRYGVTKSWWVHNKGKAKYT